MTFFREVITNVKGMEVHSPVSNPGYLKLKLYHAPRGPVKGLKVGEPRMLRHKRTSSLSFPEILKLLKFLTFSPRSRILDSYASRPLVTCC